MPAISFEEFNHCLSDAIKVLRLAKKNKVNLSSNSFYANKVRTALAGFRKSFLVLQQDYPIERYPKVGFQLSTIEPLLKNIFSNYPNHLPELIKTANEITFLVQADLAAAIETSGTSSSSSPPAPFMPNDLIEDRHFIMKKVLWEVNRCYDAACYNACAAMIRRLTETLIIEAFEHHGIAGKIKKDGDYLDFSGLIGMAISESKLGLTRNTKRILTDLKFFGDLGVHNRKALVRKDDIDKLHQATRSAIEEFVRNI